MTKSRGKKSLTKSACLLFGASGRMGTQLVELLKNHSELRLDATVTSKEILAFDEKHTAVLKHTPQSLVAVLQGADVIIDFSSATGTKALIKGLNSVEEKTVLVGTTGLSDKDKTDIKKIAKARKHRILMAGNTSLGVATLAKLAHMAAAALSPSGFDIEITETHHRMKADAPSGTALLLANVITKARPELAIVFNRAGKRKPNTIGINAVRGGGVIGEHEIRFINDDEEIKLSHRAFNRTLFAQGALHLLSDAQKNIKPGTAVELAEFLTK